MLVNLVFFVFYLIEINNNLYIFLDITQNIWNIGTSKCMELPIICCTQQDCYFYFS